MLIHKDSNLNYKNENTERKLLKIMRTNQLFNVKNSLLELENDFIDMEVKLKREVEDLFFKPIMVSIDDMDKFEQKEMKKIRPIKNNCYDGLINYIPKPIRKRVGGFKDIIIIPFKTNKPKETVYGRGKKLSKSKQ